MAALPPPQTVLGFDPSWESLGWALATEAGPLEAGVFALSGRRRRWQALAASLATLERVRARADRVAYEVPGRHGATHGRDVETVRGTSLVAGAVACWGAACPLEPWQVEPTRWRGWWGIGGGDREALKAKAVALVVREGWGAHLPERGQDDVAEAILIAVGAVRNRALAPA